MKKIIKGRLICGDDFDITTLNGDSLGILLERYDGKNVKITIELEEK